MQLCGRSEFIIWLDTLEDLSALRRSLKNSGIYICPVLQFRVGLSILIKMYFLPSLAISLLSWSIILKLDMLDQDWLLEMLCL